GERFGVPHSGPPESAQQTRDADEPARPDAVDQPAVERLHPCLEQDEQREGILNVRQFPAGAALQRLDEERPGVLQVRNHDHRDERRDELKPAIVNVQLSLLVRLKPHPTGDPGRSRAPLYNWISWRANHSGSSKPEHYGASSKSKLQAKSALTPSPATSIRPTPASIRFTRQ